MYPLWDNYVSENKLLQLAVKTTVTHIAELRKKAKNVALSEDTYDFYIGTITKKNFHFENGLKKGERPHVSASEDWHYDRYSIWLHGLTSVLFVDYETEGFCPCRFFEDTDSEMIAFENINYVQAIWKK